MIRFIAATIAALTLSGATVWAQAKPATEILTPQMQARAKNLVQDVSTVGCIRQWKPAPDDPAKMPREGQPGVVGVYLLTPLASNPTTATDLPTYILTPSGTLDFAKHLGHKVEIVGAAQAAPLPPTVQEIVTAPTQRPENKPSTNGMPRLTVTTMKMLTESCP